MKIMALKRGRKGQFILIGTLILVISLLFLMAVYSVSTIYRVKLIKSDFRNTVLKISSDMDRALEAAVANASGSWRLGYLDYQEKGNDLLRDWINTLANYYSAHGIRMRTSIPIVFKLEEMLFRGVSEAELELFSLNLSTHGFYNWRDKFSVKRELIVDENSLVKTGDEINFTFRLIDEEGRNITDLEIGPGSDNIQVYLIEQGAFRVRIPKESITIYRKNGEYKVQIKGETKETVLESLELLYNISRERPDLFKLRLVFEDSFEDRDLNGWETGGDAIWHAVFDSSAPNGSWVAKAGSIDDRNETWIRKMITLSDYGEVRFYWKVSSQRWGDYLKFYINGELKNRISGEIDWTSNRFDLSVGNNTLMWKYVKNRRWSSGADTGWIDYVQVFKRQRQPFMEIVRNIRSLCENNQWEDAYRELKRLQSNFTEYVNEEGETVVSILIDKALSYSLPTFELIVTDEMGIVTMCYVKFEAVGDVLGPETLEITLDPNPVLRSFFAKKYVTLKALISDVNLGNSTISEAEYFIGEEKNGTPMSPLDGDFDNVTEWAIATLNTTCWEVGDYKIYVHGKDSEGNWGKTKLIILRVRDFMGPSIANATFYLNSTLYPDPYIPENGTLGADKLSVNVTGITDLNNGDSNITAVKCRVYNFMYDTGWYNLTSTDGKFDWYEENATGWVDISSLPPGNYTLHIQAIDSFGNHGNLYVQNIHITRDSVGPRITYGILYNNTHRGDVIETSDISIGINVTAEDVENAGISSVRLLLKNKSTGKETSWITLNASDGQFDEWKENATGLIDVEGLAPGNYTVVVQAIDSAGNIGDNYTALTIVKLPDRLGPIVVDLTAELSKTDKTLNITALVTDVGRGDSNITIAKYRLYNSTYDSGWLNMSAMDGAYDSPTEDVNASLDVSALSPGIYIVVVRAADSFDNWSENATTSVLIDFEPPEIYAVSDWVYDPTAKTLSIEANVTDIGHGGSNITVARCRLYNDTYDSGWVVMVAVKGVYNATSEVRVNGTIDLTGLTSGLYNLEVEGYDSAWNRGNVTVENIQLDLEAPIILNLEALSPGWSLT